MCFISYNKRVHQSNKEYNNITQKQTPKQKFLRKVFKVRIAGYNVHSFTPRRKLIYNPQPLSSPFTSPTAHEHAAPISYSQLCYLILSSRNFCPFYSFF